MKSKLLSFSLFSWLLVQAAAWAGAPTATITSPSGSSTWGASQSFLVTVSAIDQEGPVAKVEVYLNEALAGTGTFIRKGTLGSFDITLGTRPPAGSYTLTARAYDNTGETTTSSAQNLTVAAAPGAPTVTTGTPEVTSTSVHLNGSFNAHGGYVGPRDSSVEYGLSTNYGAISNPPRVIGGEDPLPAEAEHPLGQYLVELERNTTYHYRWVVKSEWGTGYGADATFTTPANLPPLAEPAYIGVAPNGASPVFCDFSDPDGEAVAITSFTQPSHGTVTLGSDQPGGDLTYTPDGTFDISDEFSYTVSDQHGGSTTAPVKVTNLRKGSVGKYVLTIISYRPYRAIGAVGLSITSTGAFTGTISLLGVRYPIRGRFSTDGQFQSEIDRVGMVPLPFSLGMGPGATGMQVGGMIGDEWELVSGSALTFPENAAEAGSYTMALPSEDPDAPLGNGYIIGKVGRHGAVIFAGRIGDGQAFSFGTQLRVGGFADLFVTAGSAPRDRIHGRLQFPDAGGSVSTGDLSWYRAPRSDGAFQAGFRTNITVTGSRLALTSEDEQILEYSTELAGLDLHFEDLEGNDLFNATMTGVDEDSLEFTNSGAESASPKAQSAVARSTSVYLKQQKKPVTMKVNRRTGSFQGTLSVGDTLRTFRGVLLQHQNTGTGFLQIGKRTGLVTVTPK